MDSELCTDCAHPAWAHNGDAGEYSFRCVEGCDCAAFQSQRIEAPRLRTADPLPPPPAPEPAALDFLSALRSGRPFRRRVWVARGPTADGVSAITQEKLMQHVWLYPQILFPLVNDELQIGGPSIFRNIATGKLAPLTLPDYLATDWEIMP